MIRNTVFGLVPAFALAVGLLALTPLSSFAHCDTMDGPVVVDARAALAGADITPVLKWVLPEGEAEIRSAFQQTLSVRKLGGEARELADRWFFETLVRVHRAGEGAPYNGLKPAGSVADPSIILADKALEEGSVESLTEKISQAAAQGIRENFEPAYAAKKHSGHNVEAGRKYVAAYVQYIHYVEKLHAVIKSDAAHTEPAENASAHQH